MAGQLDDAAVRREVAVQDRQAAGRLQRLVDRTTTSWLPASPRPVGDLGQRPAVDVGAPTVHQLAAATSRCATSAMPPGVEQVDGDEAAAGLQVGDDRRPPGDRVEVVDRRAGRPPRARSPAGAARRWSSRRSRRPRRSAFSSASRVMICAGRTSSRTSRITSSPALLGDVALARIDRRHAVDAQPGEMPRNSIAIAIVLAVNWPPHAPAPGQAAVSSCVQLLGVDLARGVRADRLEHVLDRDVAGRGTCPGAIDPP